MANKKSKLKFSASEMNRLAKWLKSPEGIQKIKEAQESAEKFCQALNEMIAIDPKILDEPFSLKDTDNAEESLKAEARQRGFIKGVVFAPCDYERYMPQIEIEDPDKIYYVKQFDALYYDGYAIYHEGYWGSILYKTNH
jgi:hypothetical protein